ncbi:ABC transporter permease [Corynebacterium lizhenjunii]|uniref:ABC transporter permease n=1 Tax=Corynebacterium lizhenjunii TaxID=2709394 RepID=A0A7T0PC67_9CORY|nr:CbiQ family ECF transporter T component [Corynebacterium lizhenjunii]QPK80220.1 ABC transporter permease [Corynebacterium lizhenjunii]
MHPATVLTAAACAWLAVIAANQPWVSAGVLLAALLAGTIAAGSLSVVATTAALSVPTALSMVLIHAPYGHHRIAPLLTSDGLILAAVLALRFSALMACMLAAAAALKVADVAKWLQASRLGHKAAYVVGASLQSLPQGAHAVRAVRDANRLRGVRTRWNTVVPQVIVPVIARLLTQGTQRGEALAAIGFDRPGPRTVLEPVADTRRGGWLRWALLLATLSAIGAVLWT